MPKLRQYRSIQQTYFGSTLVVSSAADPEAQWELPRGAEPRRRPPANPDFININGNLQSSLPGSVLAVLGTVGGGPLNVVPVSSAADSQAQPARGPFKFNGNRVSP